MLPSELDARRGYRISSTGGADDTAGCDAGCGAGCGAGLEGGRGAGVAYVSAGRGAGCMLLSGSVI